LNFYFPFYHRKADLKQSVAYRNKGDLTIQNHDFTNTDVNAFVSWYRMSVGK